MDYWQIILLVLGWCVLGLGLWSIYGRMDSDGGWFLLFMVLVGGPIIWVLYVRALILLRVWK